ncbi:MAG TPA: nucleotide exchange factor GrpE [Actinomycetota bacterium]|nr:nucleotide exchange factor GrpE [Actinomycetota bacterium]
MSAEQRDDRPRFTVTDKRAPRDPAEQAPPVDPAEPREEATADPSSEVGPAPAGTDDEGDVASDEAALVAVRAELEQAWKLAGDRLDQLKRMKADHENAKARLARERAELTDRAAADVCERLLPVLDDIERALESAREHDAAGAVASGLEIVVKQFLEVLRSVGVERIDAQGTAFDPNLHEAMSSVPGDVEEPTVSTVIRQGYRMKDRTLRPALVMVTLPAEEG